MKLVWILIFMAVLDQQSRGIADGDPAFYRVDTRTPAHELPKGVCADAYNKRFEDGRAWPRFACQQGAWGVPGNAVPTGSVWPVKPPNLYGPTMLAVNLTVGHAYILTLNNGLELQTGYVQAAGFNYPGGNTVPAGVAFTATQATYYLFSLNYGQAVTTVILPACAEQGCIRFTDPNGYDTVVVATDDWRDGAGEDGGRGRVWKIIANNVPEAVPLNGNDIYGAVQFVPCLGALVLLRADNERHYFQAAAVGNPAANKIQLNCAPAWVNGDQAFLWGDVTVGSAINGTSAPNIMSFVFVKNLGANVISLYADSGLTQLLNFTSAVGRFYLERRAAAPGLFGNVAPPLIAQPNATGNTIWETGFAAVPANVSGTGAAATGIFTVANHRFLPGDNVTLSGMAAGDTPVNGAYYAYPLNVNQFQLFDTQAHALAAATGGSTGLKAISITNGSTPTFAKVGASGLPMPPAAGGYYHETNRLVLFNGNTLMISDPLDPLHYSPQSATLTANLGESDPVIAVSSFLSADCIVILKKNSVLALYNFSGGPTQWALRSVTREYGCQAVNSVKPYAARLVFLSRRGLDSVEYNAFGVVLPKNRPISHDMLEYVNRLDWLHIAQSAVEIWNNRLFWAVRLKSTVANGLNNAVLTINLLNSDPDKGQWGWEGAWGGTLLQVQGWAKHTIQGEERLAFVNATGQVYWMGDGCLDYGNAPIADSLTTRIYAGVEHKAAKDRAVWQTALVGFDSNNANLTVTAVAAGYNDTQTLTPAGGLVYDPTQYVYGEGATYNPATQQPAFGTPGRADYAIQNVTELIGGVPDVLQNHTEPFRMRYDTWGVQLVIANSQGQCRVESVEVGAVRGPSSQRSKV